MDWINLAQNGDQWQAAVLGSMKGEVDSLSGS